MVDEPEVDDPFERAAKREQREAYRERIATRAAQTFDYDDHPGVGAAAMVGVTAAWGVVLWLHSYLAGTDGLFKAHLVVFVLFGAITVGMVCHAIALRVLIRKP